MTSCSDENVQDITRANGQIAADKMKRPLQSIIDDVNDNDGVQTRRA